MSDNAITTKSAQILSDIVTFTKYSKFVPEIGRRETWEELVERNMAMHINKYPKLKDEIQQVYKNFVLTKKVLPSMRSLQFGGKPIQNSPNRIFNCFTGATEFLTSDGVRTFEETVGKKVDVLAGDGVWRKAEVKSFGEQSVNAVTVKPPYRTNYRRTYEATPNHRWILDDGTETTNLKVGDRVATWVDNPDREVTQDFYDGFGHGVVFGDGSQQVLKERFMVRLCGGKASALSKLKKHSGYRTVSYPSSGDGDAFVTIVDHRQNLKKIPFMKNPEYLCGFIEGWLFCDGHRKVNTESLCLDTQDENAADWLMKNAAYAGYVVTGVSVNDNPTNYGERSAPLNRVSLRRSCPYYIVEAIEENISEEEVYCVVEPVTQMFTLAGGVLTGNCAYMPVDHPDSFAEAMFLLLGGTGVGYSVQRHHVSELPAVVGPLKKRKRFLVGDSIEGWADAVKILCESYFYGKPRPVFDFSDIRPKGAALITSGGKAPGPQPLKDCLHNIEKVLDQALEESGRGVQLEPIQVHDIMCYIADAVLAGGIRRAALISLFSMDDEEMLTAKHGAWWEHSPHRGRANNSAVILRHKVSRRDFDELWDKIVASESGEPGVLFSNDKDWGTNP